MVPLTINKNITEGMPIQDKVGKIDSRQKGGCIMW